MTSELRKHFDLLVVGGGPAGMAAAASAAECGARVGILDDNPALGGQIWRGEVAKSDPLAAAWTERLRLSRVELLTGMRVFDQPEANVLLAEGADACKELGYRNLLIATGARERFLPFPGWTLPNVTGAGALQALVKSGLPIRGKRVVLAGTGPLLLAVAAYLMKCGAEVVLICEQATRTALARFAVKLMGHAGKISQALSLRKELSGVRLVTGAWPVEAEGKDALEAVMISHRGRRERITCDYLACGFHLVPNTELAAVLGCDLRNGYVAVDEFQRTSMRNIFCAGEPTGIGGVELSLIEGQIAGLVSAGQEGPAKKLFNERRKYQGFARALDRTFALRPELRKIAEEDTIVCRCEDVTFKRLAGHRSWKSAKLHTRCGMGPCQGRVCGAATQFLFGWTPGAVRPPIFPARLKNLESEPCGSLHSTQ